MEEGATLPFMLAVGALDAGHEVEIVLANEATLLVRDRFIWQIQGFGMAPLKDLMDRLRNAKVPIYVSSSDAQARDVTDEDLKGKNCTLVNAKEIADLMAGADRIITF